MSTLERRLQILLDQERYDRVAREADATNRSVAAVIREAIDRSFPSDAHQRALALGEFLDLTAVPDPGQGEDWAEAKTATEDARFIELERKMGSR